MDSLCLKKKISIIKMKSLKEFIEFVTEWKEDLGELTPP